MVSKEVREIGDIEKRLFELIDLLLNNNKLASKQDFYEATGISRQHIPDIKSGIRKLTISQMKTICDLYRINANWFLGIEDNVFRKRK